jgi:large subunit ribosomal protein L24
MKKKFSKHWKSSKQIRKQRKYVANAPLHIKRRMISSELSKELREKHKIRSISLRTGDEVKITKGKFKGKQGKISRVNTKKMKVYIEGIQVKKQDGSKASIPLKAPNLEIINLNLEDKKRLIKKPEKDKENKK